MKVPKILVIGSLNMDMVIQVNDMPKVGETVLGKSIKYVPGGKGANQAFAAAKLNGNVSMIGKVGGDDFGTKLINNLSLVGVDTSAIEMEHCSTGLASIYVNNEGNNSIVVIPGANATCNKSYVEKHKDKILSSDLVILQMEIPLDAIEYSIKVAKENNKTVILNPAPAPSSLSSEILSHLDYITPNETELAKLTNMPTDTIEEVIEAAKKLIAEGVKNVIVTCGSKGSVFVNEVESKHYAVKPVKAIDTTAAGDTFNAAFAVSLLESNDISKSIAFANKVSGIAVTREGAQDSIPSRVEVDNIME